VMASTLCGVADVKHSPVDPRTDRPDGARVVAVERGDAAVTARR